jgi:hypothetical protein
VTIVVAVGPDDVVGSLRVGAAHERLDGSTGSSTMWILGQRRSWQSCRRPMRSLLIRQQRYRGPQSDDLCFTG